MPMILFIAAALAALWFTSRPASDAGVIATDAAPVNIDPFAVAMAGVEYDPRGHEAAEYPLGWSRQVPDNRAFELRTTGAVVGGGAAQVSGGSFVQRVLQALNWGAAAPFTPVTETQSTWNAANASNGSQALQEQVAAINGGIPATTPAPTYSTPGGATPDGGYVPPINFGTGYGGGYAFQSLVF